MTTTARFTETTWADYPNGLTGQDRMSWEAEADLYREGITLAPEDFVVIDGEPTLDGMDPKEWLDAMTMD